MTADSGYPFEIPSLSAREYKRRVEPLLIHFLEELERKAEEMKRGARVPFRYDIANDMLHVFVDTSENTISSPGYNGIYVDYDPDRERIVGITVIGYNKLLGEMQGTNGAKKAWRKAQWGLRILSWLESLSAILGISLEDIQRNQVKNAVLLWIDNVKNNPSQLKLMPVSTPISPSTS